MINFNDEDDFDFNFDDLSDDEKQEIENGLQEQDKRIRNHPLFIKANEIITLVAAILESLPDEYKEMYGSTLMESAYMLAPKLAGAMGSGSWLLCMQNASIIRYHAEYLLTASCGLKMFTAADDDYINIMRKEMLGFQQLFRQWMKELNTMEEEEYTDEWGLFLRR